MCLFVFLFFCLRKHQHINKCKIWTCAHTQRDGKSVTAQRGRGVGGGKNDEVNQVYRTKPQLKASLCTISFGKRYSDIYSTFGRLAKKNIKSKNTRSKSAINEDKQTESHNWDQKARVSHKSKRPL